MYKKILAIGNSFSEDATTYLYKMIENTNPEVKIVNLFIGGCSLETHCENIEKDAPEYRYDINGKVTDRYVSVKECLLEDDWDLVTLQQASRLSGTEESYYPYIITLFEYVKRYAPHARQAIHQTWAYEANNEGFTKADQINMYKSLKSAYEKAASTLGVKIISSGTAIETLRGLKEFDYENGGQSLCRDGFHMHLIYGRYALSALWYETVFKQNILTNEFMPDGIDGVECDEKLIFLIRKTIHALRLNDTYLFSP